MILNRGKELMQTITEKEKLNNLIIAVKNGNKYALGEIYSIAGGRMLSIAMGLLRNKQWAEDVLQDSFVKVVRFSVKYKENSNAYAWLCTIIRNTALNKLKSEKLKAGDNIDSFFDISDNGLPAERKDTALIVEGALKKLEPRERTIVWLRYYNDLTVKEIANELNMPSSTVHFTLKRTEEKLKKILE